MNFLWKMTIVDVLEIYRRARADGVKEGESIQKYVTEYMKEKNIKPIGATELTNEELMNEQASHGKNVLKIETDDHGETKIKFKKGKKNERGK